MIIQLAVAVAVVALLMYFLRVEVVSEKSFKIDSTVTRSAIFDFLKTPTNLERIHPNILKVLDIRSENSTIRFQILEDMGALFGKMMFPMTLTTLSSDASLVSSKLRLDSKSSAADVSVTLAVSDYDATLQVTQASKTQSQTQPSAIIQGCITVKAMRILSYVLSRYLLSIWVKTIREALDILTEESQLNHKKTS